MAPGPAFSRAEKLATPRLSLVPGRAPRIIRARSPIGADPGVECVETMSKLARSYRLGVVSYLNARPLVHGLDHDPDVTLRFDVPARLPELLDSGAVDAALVPVIDLAQHGRDWQIVSDACIGCDGETLTVRVFSRVPPERVTRLHVDGDSHTSVVLAQIVWREAHGTQLDVLPYRGQERVDECEAVLLIGDKVVANTLIDYDIQTDLGAAWKSLTGLPFVFAVWAAPRGLDLAELAARLSTARDVGVRAAELIAADYGPAKGWPVALARRYLAARLKFNLGPRQRAAMTRFFDLARRYGLVPAGRDLVFA